MAYVSEIIQLLTYSLVLWFWDIGDGGHKF